MGRRPVRWPPRPDDSHSSARRPSPFWTVQCRSPVRGVAFTISSSGTTIGLPAAIQIAETQTMELWPENIRIVPLEGSALTATGDLVKPTGPEEIVKLNVGGHVSVIRTPAGIATQGGTVGLDVHLHRALFFDRGSGQRF